MSEGTSMYDLPAPTRPSRPTVNQPGDVNHWLIPGAVLVTAALWVAVWTVLANDHDPALSTMEMALLVATGVVTVSTVQVVKGYLIHKAVSENHATILGTVADNRTAVLAEVEDLRAQFIVAAAEQRILIEQVNATLGDISAKQQANTKLYWENVAEEALSTAGAGVVPFGRRH